MSGGRRFKGHPDYQYGPDELAWVAEHPDSARGWADADRILAWSMTVTLVVGLALNLVGYGIGSGAISTPGWLPGDLTSQLVSDLGVILWTSVILVLFIEIIPERSRRRAARYLAGARDALREQGRPIPTELLQVDLAEPGGSVQAATLEAVLEQVRAIERTLEDRLPRRQG